MAFDTFMVIDGVKGETQDSVYKDKGAFEIFSFSWGASNPATIGSTSSGAGAGKVSISSFNIMKKTESSSLDLFKACCKGSHFDTAYVVLRKAGGTEAVEYLRYDFEEVYVDSVQWSGSSGGDDTPTESVSFAFGKVTISYFAQSSKGTKGTEAPKAGWDVRTNKGL